MGRVIDLAARRAEREPPPLEPVGTTGNVRIEQVGDAYFATIDHDKVPFAGVGDTELEAVTELARYLGELIAMRIWEARVR